MPILEARGLSVTFGGLKALADVNLSIDAGELLAVIGPNGAGKSTLLNALTGLYKASAGRVFFDGHDITGNRPDVIVRGGIGRIFQNGKLFRRLSVLENVMLGAAIAPVPAKETSRPRTESAYREAAILMLERFGLAPLAMRSVDSLSYGNRRLIEMAKVLAGHPRLLLLDEPAAGLNLGEVEALMTRLRQSRADHGLTIVLIEHNVGMVMRLAERIVVLNFGQKLAEGTPTEIQRDPRVLEAYLGTGYEHVEVQSD